MARVQRSYPRGGCGALRDARVRQVRARQSFVFLDLPAMQQPEMSIGNAAKLFDESGTLTDDRVRNLVKVFIDTFAAWVERQAPTA